jgi:hypothetical protein
MPDNIDELVRHFICSLIHVPYHINPFFLLFFVPTWSTGLRE